ncbi:DUF3347 domain-containing protein [Maribacter polysiphoniae]|jgi:hypothetical protein|uniref:DUF3347 domain-containing protein n=2 Tax=Flavobacteriaceae TaxID=49546 RepID=A0A316E0L6_9FLAO|nr:MULTISPECIES: DUF3347 domain-containing protein [Flavobacteriaceae]MBD1260692.1 DUF3347 domain-containing protein [Maribacter polysiphoniae]PWK24177.1 uncharacterized protein DUF3347 [Maribacter polysiphoniae]RPG36724.1 MAG: DUF3347 domain-containing protein [Muricauda sp. TMED12]RYC51653.1 hypothetical protein DN53_12520 [Allomuricauda olearia]|tara:strand:+ start:452 stop:973 length:522 start_codon:yes stop_codon:yes gene_type:complete
MKNLKNAVATLLMLGTTMGYAQHKIELNHDHSKMEMKVVELEFNDENIANVYEHYEHIKNDLVGSNPGDAQKGAVMLNEALEKVEGSEAALSASQKIAATDDLERQRKAFSDLSNEMETLLKGRVTSGKIYKDFCPMALNGGAYWLSAIKDIRNPYYGAKMLSCGKVTAIIEK